MHILRLTIIVAVFLSFIPISASAASSKVSCSLTVVTGGTQTTVKDKKDVLVKKGDEVRIVWSSKNAKKVTNADGDEVLLTGTQVAFPEKSTTYSYTASSGSKKAKCSVTMVVVSGSINASSLSSESAKPTISGTASGAKKVQVLIQPQGSDKTAFKSKEVKVKNGKWSVKSTKNLADGAYDVFVSGGKGTAGGSIATGTLYIGDAAATTFSVSSVPLLFGGTARLGASTPVSYLRITNTGKQAATLSGFTVTQRGSAPTSSIIGLTTVDDKALLRGSVGGSEGSTPFKNGSAFAPMNATFAPGQMRLFTIRAVVSNNAQHVGKQLIIDVTGIQATAAIKAAFPIRGTTWTIGY